MVKKWEEILLIRGHIEKSFVLVILLIAGLSDVASAVITVDDGFCASYESSAVVAQSAVLIAPVSASGTYSASLAEIGAELIKAPTAEAAAANLMIVVGDSANYKVMPAAPAAFLLVLTGFLCVSLVKDRKTWLAACVGLVCLGQLSVSVLPKLAGNLRNAFKAGSAGYVASQRIDVHDSHFRVRSEVEGTGYIGLLRKLSGILDGSHDSSFNTRFTTGNVCDFVISTQQNLNYKVSTFAAHISGLFDFDFLSPCRVRSAGHILVFSPALIISNLPHGPPA